MCQIIQPSRLTGMAAFATDQLTANSEELTATIHTFLEGIRSDNEVSDAGVEKVADGVDELATEAEEEQNADAGDVPTAS
jgi:hypothetical protein